MNLLETMDTINKIIKKQSLLFPKNGGALKDPKDKRDYKADEILAGVKVIRPSFKEGYSVIEKVWSNMPPKDQGSTFSCVGQAWSQYKQILQKKDTGEETELSAFSIYNPISYPGVGSYIRDGGMRTVNYGINKESTLPSAKDEPTMTRKFDFSPYEKEAEFYKNRLVASVKTQNFEKLADMIFLNDGIVSGWGSHAVYFDSYGTLNGVRYLKTPNSYGAGKELYYFEEKMSPLFSAWTAIDLKVVQADPDALFSDLKYGDKGNQVIRLKKALARLGWFSEPGDVYDANLAWVVMNYKLANFDLRVWARFWEMFYFRGREVDQKTRENINHNLQFRK